MGLFKRNKNKHDPLVRVIDLAADKLEPNSKYLFVFNRQQINVRDALIVGKSLRELQIKSTIVLADGDVRSAVRAYSIPEDDVTVIDDGGAIAASDIDITADFIDDDHLTHQ